MVIGAVQPCSVNTASLICYKPESDEESDAEEEPGAHWFSGSLPDFWLYSLVGFVTFIPEFRPVYANCGGFYHHIQSLFRLANLFSDRVMAGDTSCTGQSQVGLKCMVCCKCWTTHPLCSPAAISTSKMYMNEDVMMVLDLLTGQGKSGFSSSVPFYISLLRYDSFGCVSLRMETSVEKKSPVLT